MSSGFGFSDIECKIIQHQIARRAKYRCEFLKARTDPSMHAAEAGFVFDPAMQRYLSTKVTQYEFFVPCPRTARFGIFSIVIPMFAYGYWIKSDRDKTEAKIRKGQICYRDRAFKFA